MENPFTIMFGKQPREFIARTEATETIIKTFSSKNPSTQAFLLTGVRGTGKTVLLSAICNYFRNNNDWIVVDLNPQSKDLLRDLASLLYNERGLNYILKKAKINLSFFGIGVDLESSEPLTDIHVALKTIMEHINKNNKRILISVDETLNTPELRNFACEYQILIRQNFPVFLLLAGLPENITNLQNEKLLTFLLRTPKIYLDSLNLMRIRNKYMDIFGFTEEVAYEMTAFTKGYAYAFQLLGYYTFEMKKDYISAMKETKMYLFENVYDKIWSELSLTDKKVLFAIHTSQSSSVKEIRKEISMESNIFSVYRLRLLRKGILKKTEYGNLVFSLPLFDEYLQEKQYFYDVER